MNLLKKFKKTIQVLIFFTFNYKKEQKITSLFTIIVTILRLGELVTFANKPKLVSRKKAYCYSLETAASVNDQAQPWLRVFK